MFEPSGKWAKGNAMKHIVTSVSLLTIRELMVKTPPTEVLVQTCQLVDRAGVKPLPQPIKIL